MAQAQKIQSDGGPLILSYMDKGGKIAVQQVADGFGMSKTQLPKRPGLRVKRSTGWSAAGGRRRRTASAKCSRSSAGSPTGRAARSRQWRGIAPSPSRHSRANGRSSGEGRQGGGRARLSRSHGPRGLCLRFTGTCYRAHDPRWAFKPASGDGAAIKGAASIRRP